MTTVHRCIIIKTLVVFRHSVIVPSLWYSYSIFNIVRRLFYYTQIIELGYTKETSQRTIASDLLCTSSGARD